MSAVIQETQIPQTLARLPRRTLRVGLLGCGTVGTSVAQLLLENSAQLTQSIGASVELAQVAVLHLDKPRSISIERELLTDDALRVAGDPSIDIVIEVIGGIEPARSLILAAISSGKSVITANKELLASYGDELFAAASWYGVDLRFEASVCGAVPLIRSIREALVGDRINRVVGIVNGTTNFILSQMTRLGWSLDQALARAQELGYAESDPSADSEGFDAAAKASILASLAFGVAITAEDVYRQGITSISAADIASAHELGYVIKLLAIAERQPAGIDVRVHPTLLATDHPLAGVDDRFNAVFVEAERAERLMFYGPGAGGGPTASAVLGDLVSVARNRILGVAGNDYHKVSGIDLLSINDLVSRYFLRFGSIDSDGSGLVSRVEEVLGEWGIRIERSTRWHKAGGLSLICGPTTERTLWCAVAALQEENFDVVQTLRVGDDT